jgi:hypothetical protein
MIQAAGYRAGYRWAKEQADLQAIAERVAELDLGRINDAFTAGERLHFAISEDPDREAAAEFWGSLNDDEHPDEYFVVGFADGALAAADEEYNESLAAFDVAMQPSA